MGETIPFVTPGRPEKLTASVVAQLEKEYGKSARTIRLWFKEGAPVADPASLVNWWAANKTWSCPTELLAAAERARLAENPQSPAIQPPASPGGEPLELGTFNLGEGEEVQQLRRLVAIAYGELEKAYAGKGGDVDRLQARYNKASEALRKAQATWREDQRKAGRLLVREDVETDVDTACEMLRQMRESMARQVLEQCAALLNQEQQEAVSRAILKVRAAEDHIFRTLPSLAKTDVQDLLAA